MVPEQTPPRLIWRDDDISVDTNLEQLIRVDDILRVAGLTHTIAVIAEGFQTSTVLVDAIVRRGMDVQLHCWRHDDLTTTPDLLKQLADGADMITRVFGQRPTVLYPPWNRSDERVEQAAASLGLRVSTEKVSLQQYIRVKGDVAEDVINFHYWSAEERRLLPDAVQVYQRIMR